MTLGLVVQIGASASCVVQPVRDDFMSPNYLVGIFQWRDHAGDLDHGQATASLRTLLFGCERWVEDNPAALDTANGRRLLMIKRELEEYIGRQKK